MSFERSSGPARLESASIAAIFKVSSEDLARGRTSWKNSFPLFQASSSMTLFLAAVGPLFRTGNSAEILSLPHTNISADFAAS